MPITTVLFTYDGAGVVGHIRWWVAQKRSSVRLPADGRR